MLARCAPVEQRTVALRWNANFIARMRETKGVSGILLYAMEHDVAWLGELLEMMG